MFLCMYRDGVTDDVTGQDIPDELVKIGMIKELEYCESKGVWELVTIAECRRLTGRAPTSDRWVCNNTTAKMKSQA